MTDNTQMRNAFNEVKQAIAAKEYDKARNLLLQIDHPKRDEWLARLEQSAQRQRVDKQPKPWNPNWISSMSIVMTPLVSSIALGWNWRRFGKKDWVLPTIIGYFIVLILLITSFMVIPAIAKPVSNSGLYMLYFSPVLILAMFHFLYPIYIGGRQAGAYKLIQEKGVQAGFTHQYDWGKGTVFYIAQSLVIALCIALWIGYQQRPQTFDDGWVQVTYPGHWKTIELSGLPFCTDEDSNAECRFAVQKGSYGSVGLIVSSLDVNGTGEAKELGESFWQIVLDDPAYEPIARDVYSFAGMDGYYVTYSGESYYGTDIFVVDDSGVLYVRISSYSKEVMTENWEQIETILQTIRLH
jgi:hypothetical protein